LKYVVRGEEEEEQEGEKMEKQDQEEEFIKLRSISSIRAKLIYTATSPLEHHLLNLLFHLLFE